MNRKMRIRRPLVDNVAVKLLFVLVGAGLLTLRPATLSAQQAHDQVTYARDVAPIIQENCVTCHRPGSIGAMSLETYEQVRSWAPRIKERTTKREMPPWPIDMTVGIQEFKNDRSLSEAEIETIARWVDAGAPMGDPAEVRFELQNVGDGVLEIYGADPG